MIGVKDYKVICEGDDVLIGSKDPFVLKELFDAYKSLGFQTTADHNTSLEGLEFCKNQFAVQDGKLVCFKPPKYSLFKLGWVTNNTPRQFSKKCRL